MTDTKQLLEDLKNCMNEATKSDNKDAVFVSIPLKDMPTVIEAIEKQTPKKPILIGDGYADGCMVYDFWKCPFCENSFEVDFQEYDCCPNCGQKIDWRVPDDSASETE